MKTEKELLQLQNESESNETNNSNSNSETTGIIKLEGNHPFAAYRADEEEKWKIIIGNMQATPETFESIEQAQNYVQTTPWDLIGSMIIAITENYNDIKNSNSQK